MASPWHKFDSINTMAQKGERAPNDTAPKKWIAGAIKHPGALHRQLHVPQGQSIPAKKLAAAAQKGGVLGRRARLAKTLKGLH
jgi:hypothetical protein